MIISKDFYSNCLIEVLKAKLKNPKIKITYVSPFANEVFCPHFLWSDGENDYDFGIERHLKWYEKLYFKGHIRQRELRFNEKYKQAVLRTKAGEQE
jgi:hypothetical protein